MRAKLVQARDALMTCPDSGARLSLVDLYCRVLLVTGAIAAPPVIAILLGGLL